MDVKPPSPVSYTDECDTDLENDQVSDFIANWVHMKHFYTKAAELAHEFFENLLASNAIPSILRERQRRHNKVYKQPSDIRNDIVDLAGLRIALYFPSDREKVADIIKSEFRVIKHVKFPKSSTSPNDTVEASVADPETKVGTQMMDSGFAQRFGGYLADHYRVKFKTENLRTEHREDFRKSNPMIEIQVASVLMHAWSEIDHDLVYKTLTSGRPSDEELRLLDATNGLVHTGELLLQQLQTAVDNRVSYQNQLFSDQYELASFLRQNQKLTKSSMDHLDILLKVLRVMKLDSPGNLAPKIQNLILEDTLPAALGVLEHILTTIPEAQEKELILVGDGNRDNSSQLLGIQRKHSILDGIDAKNGKITLNSDTRASILYQLNMVKRIVQISDAMMYPRPSIVALRDSSQKSSQFHSLYSDFLGLKIELKHERPSSGPTQASIKLVQSLEELLVWFENNEDILFRVCFNLARLNLTRVVGTTKQEETLAGTTAGGGFQQLPEGYPRHHAAALTKDGKPFSSHSGPGAYGGIDMSLYPGHPGYGQGYIAPPTNPFAPQHGSRNNFGPEYFPASHSHSGPGSYPPYANPGYPGYMYSGPNILPPWPYSDLETETVDKGEDLEREKKLLAIEELLKNKSIDLQKAQKEVAEKEKEMEDRKKEDEEAKKLAEMTASWETKLENSTKAAFSEGVERARREQEAKQKALEDEGTMADALGKPAAVRHLRTLAADDIESLNTEAAIISTKTHGEVPRGKKKPIRFQDTDGRTFIFPFEMCETWAEMEKLITQAFSHGGNNSLVEGKYSLIDPDGSIILPQVWESIIEPGWTIIVQTWPTGQGPKEPAVTFKE